MRLRMIPVGFHIISGTSLDRAIIIPLSQLSARLTVFLIDKYMYIRGLFKVDLV